MELILVEYREVVSSFNLLATMFVILMALWRSWGLFILSKKKIKMVSRFPSGKYLMIVETIQWLLKETMVEIKKKKKMQILKRLLYKENKIF